MTEQVALFGSISKDKDWRKQLIIPLLEELNVSYFNPVVDKWTPDLAKKEAAIMAQAETIVMVFDDTSPSFTGLAEAGWAAVGVAQRGQHFVLYVDTSYELNIPNNLLTTDLAKEWAGYFKHWASSIRQLTVRHAQEANLETLHLCNSLDAVCDTLRQIYSKPSSSG